MNGIIHLPFVLSLAKDMVNIVIDPLVRAFGGHGMVFTRAEDLTGRATTPHPACLRGHAWEPWMD